MSVWDMLIINCSNCNMLFSEETNNDLVLIAVWCKRLGEEGMVKKILWYNLFPVSRNKCINLSQYRMTRTFFYFLLISLALSAGSQTQLDTGKYEKALFFFFLFVLPSDLLDRIKKRKLYYLSNLSQVGWIIELCAEPWHILILSLIFFWYVFLVCYWLITQSWVQVRLVGGHQNVENSEWRNHSLSQLLNSHI